MEGLQAKVNLTEASTALRKTAKNVEGISTELHEFGGFLPVMLLHIKGNGILLADRDHERLGRPYFLCHIKRNSLR